MTNLMKDLFKNRLGGWEVRRGFMRLSVFLLLGFLTAYCTDPSDPDPDPDPDPDKSIIDKNGNGLIEISSLLELHNIRYNLRGTSYKTTFTNDEGNSNGCPTGRCTGYELMNDLDFDKDGDGKTFEGDCDVIVLGNNPRTDFSNCNIDPDDVDTTYFHNTMGWSPIGGSSFSTRFTGIFEGNNHKIKNIFVKRDIESAGLFASVGSGGQIRNIGIEGGLIVSSPASSNSFSASHAGGLVGKNASGMISNSYATGNVSSSSSSSDSSASRAYSGGLVGFSERGGMITNSYATGNVSSSSSSSDSGALAYSGGLVGFSENRGMITNSYATGNVSSSSSSSDFFSGFSSSAYSGGLVGFNEERGMISNSYATGNVSSSDSSDSYSGGLVGENARGMISNSYATGNVSASSSRDTLAGGLVGDNGSRGIISNSYATGNVSSSSSRDTRAGGLVGFNGSIGRIANSYRNSEASVTQTGSSGGTFGNRGTPLTKVQLKAISGIYPSALVSPWNLGTDQQYPGLCINSQFHRPLESGDGTFVVTPAGSCGGS